MSEQVPMPNTCDSYYADQAGQIRRWLAFDGDPYLRVVARPSLPTAHWNFWDTPIGCDENPCTSFQTVVLHRRQCRASAPWTGSPYFYLWSVAMDGEGRSVAGGAERWYL